MPRFVILEHDHPSLHWDLMLESSEKLLTWRLAETPVVNKTIVASPLPDHRVLYLDYEGEVSGGRGSVRRWDSGEYEWIRRTDEELAMRLSSRRVHGIVHLCRVSSGGWRFELMSDDEPRGESASRLVDRCADRPET